MTDTNWRHDHLPPGFPTNCSGDELRGVIQCLYEELSMHTKEGKSNDLWRFLITNSIESARSELQFRTARMALYISIISVSISVVAIFTSTHLQIDKVRYDTFLKHMVIGSVELGSDPIYDNKWGQSRLICSMDKMGSGKMVSGTVNF